MSSCSLWTSQDSNQTYTTHGNGTDTSTVPLIVGLSVGVPLSLFAISAVVAAIVWQCSRSRGNFKSMEPRANAPKNIEAYPPGSASGYPAAAASDHIYENYQAGGASPHLGARSQPPGNKGQRSVWDTWRL